MELKSINDAALVEHLDGLHPDTIDVFILDHGNYRGALIHGTHFINQMRANHEYGPLETLIAGHAYLAAGLLTSNIKGQDRIQLKIRCEGPAKGVSAEATANGTVRGHVEHNPILEETINDVYDMSAFIGEGTLSVTKKLQSAKSPYTGLVPLEHGNIAQDLTYYFLKSEQIPTAFNLSISFDEKGRAVGAGGLFIQAFPSASEQLSLTLDSRIRTLPSLGKLFSEGYKGDDILNEYFSDVSAVHIGEKPITFYCHCSKEWFARFIKALPDDDLQDIKDNGPFPLKTTCHNCNTTYEYSYEDIQRVSQQ
jgi:molecular chaperone Hsp33